MTGKYSPLSEKKDYLSEVLSPNDPVRSNLIKNKIVERNEIGSKGTNIVMEFSMGNEFMRDHYFILHVVRISL